MATELAAKPANRVGKKSVRFSGRPGVLSTFTIAGPMEGRGPLGSQFDTVMPDEIYGERCWEQTESKMLKEAVKHSILNGGLQESDIDFMMTGDLLNQCTSSSFAAKDLALPHFGLFAACATFGAGMILGSIAIEGGFAEHVVVAVSSHHQSAERQFRFPTELGVQRPPTAQWTATIGAAIVIGNKNSSFAPAGKMVHLTGATFGEVIEMGVKDPYDMGSAMAPAAAETLSFHFKDFAVSPDEYDLIITGDLGAVGNKIVADLLETKGIAVKNKLDDCGLLLYDRSKQDVHAGGSGTACSAGVFCAYIERGMKEGKWRKVLFAPTGSLHSPTSYKQGQPMPTICHAIAMEVG